MARSFRTGVFEAEIELLRSHLVLYQLGLVLAQLYSGKKKAVNYAPFANTLELDNAVQQDGQEFMKLLLSLLERVLGMSQNIRTRNVVQKVFQVIHMLSRFTSLEESLNDYLSEGILLTDNQLMCESCQMHVNVTHCPKLRSLPPLLNFQLKRFACSTKTSTKKEMITTFSFPTTIDMGPRLSEESEKVSGAVYNLSAILVHRGSIANSGRYVAFIKDDRGGECWQFDDEQVTSLGFHPLGDITSQAAASKVFLT